MAVIDDLIEQIKAQGTIGQWKGSVGSDVALKGMAKALADQGITNINQVGMITQTGLSESVRPDGRGGFVDLKGNSVDPSIVQTNEYAGEAGNWTDYSAPIGTQRTIGNKETGQALVSKYGTPEKTDPNMFGGTGEGKGGTSYNVQFDQAGNPIFYANKVASQSAGTLGFGLKLALAAAGLNGLEGLLANTATTAGTNALSALDAGMGTYGSGTGLLNGAIDLSALDAGLEAYPTTGNIGASALDAGMNVYPSTGTIEPSALDAGMNAYPTTGNIGQTATAAALSSPLSVSDALRAAGLVATIAGAGKLASSGTGGGGYDIVPIPSEWTSPIKPTGTAEFTPLAPIDFGNKEMLRGTQWEQLLSPDYGKAPAMPTMPSNPSNMSYDQLTKILGGSRESIPTANLSINDVIAGIQSQYGQAPKGSMG
jgi:hypothetical protein